MHLALFNPQGNFDPLDRFWTEHPDFGGQLVYVKELSLALADQGHTVDIITRQVRDADWPGLSANLDAYPGHDAVRIVRVPCGGGRFVAKEELWPFLGPEWVPGIVSFYEQSGPFPDAVLGHYADGGLAAALFEMRTGIPFTFTAHSLGAWKLDGLRTNASDVRELEER